MGVEARYHAVPEDWHILRQVSRDARFAKYLQCLDSYLNDPAYRLGAGCSQELDPEEEDFVVAVQSLKATRPGIEQRYFYEGTRSWDVLSYVLSSAYRDLLKTGKGSIDTINDPLFWAVQGRQILHPNARATQGIPYRFLGAADTQQAYRLLLAVQPEVLQTFYYPKVMRDLGVYKAFDVDFEFVWQVIQKLRHFYAQTADAGEGTLVVID